MDTRVGWLLGWDGYSGGMVTRVGWKWGWEKGLEQINKLEIIMLEIMGYILAR